MKRNVSNNIGRCPHSDSDWNPSVFEVISGYFLDFNWPFWTL